VAQSGSSVSWAGSDPAAVWPTELLLLSSLCVLRGLPVPVPTTKASVSVNTTSGAVHHHSTHLSLHDSVPNTVDDLIDNIDKIAIGLVVPKSHECPGLKILVPGTLDDPLVVLFSRGFYSAKIEP